jgi:hypothetical protein
MGAHAERLQSFLRSRKTSNDHWFQLKHIDGDSVLYLVRNLENLEKNEAIRNGLRVAGNVFKVGGQKRLRERMKSGRKGVTGNLLRSFYVRTKRYKLGTLVGFKQGKNGGSHAYLVDRGTDNRYWKTKKGKSVGRGLPNSFWSDTEAQDYPRAMDKLYRGIENAVNRINNRR